MRTMLFPALIAAFLGGCATTGPDPSAEYAAQVNTDKRVWPPVVEGQAFPVQFLWDEH